MRELGVLGNDNYKLVCMLDHKAMLTVQTEKYGVFDCKPLQFIWAKVRFGRGCIKATCSRKARYKKAETVQCHAPLSMVPHCCAASGRRRLICWARLLSDCLVHEPPHCCCCCSCSLRSTMRTTQSCWMTCGEYSNRIRCISLGLSSCGRISLA